MQKNIFRLALITAALLLIPLVAMQFSSDVVWTLGDFVFAGVLIFGTGLTYLLISKKTGTIAYRFAVGLALAATLLLIWINLAVGIIGSEDNPLNGLYFGVILVEILAVIIARLRPLPMARALYITAAAQASVPVVALLIGRPAIDSVEAVMGIVGVCVLSWFFAGLFVASGLSFRRASVST